MNKYNQMTFTQEEFEKGYMNDFIEVLFKLNGEYLERGEPSELFNDIHIKTDGLFHVVEWVQTDIDQNFGSFRFVDEDSKVVSLSGEVKD